MPRCLSGKTGSVLLIERTKGYRFEAPIACPASGAPFAFSLPVYPGTYAVFADSVFSTREYLVNPSLVVTTDLPGLVVDIETYSVSLAIQRNASPAPCGPLVQLVPTTGLGDSVYLSRSCSTMSLWSDAEVGKGSYTVFYGGHQSTLPLSVTGNTVSTVALVETFPISGAVAVTGALLPCSGTVDLTFVGDAGGASRTIPCPTTGTLPFSVDLPAGTYRVQLNTASLRSILLTSTLVVSNGTSTLSLPLELRPVSGTIHFPIGPISPCLVERNVNFSKPDGQMVVAPATCLNAAQPAVLGYSTAVPTGTWELQFDDAWRSLYIVDPSLAISAPRPSLDFDVSLVDVSGPLSLNGAPLACTVGSLYLLQSRLSYLSADACGYRTPTTPSTEYRAVAHPGTYRATVSRSQAMTAIGVRLAKPGITVLNQPTIAVPLDFVTFPVSGAVTLNGQTPLSNCMGANRAILTLTENTLQYEVELTVPCVSGPYVFSGMVPAGEYDVSVAGVGAGLPAVPWKSPLTLRVP